MFSARQGFFSSSGSTPLVGDGYIVTININASGDQPLSVLSNDDVVNFIGNVNYSLSHIDNSILYQQLSNVSSDYIDVSGNDTTTYATGGGATITALSSTTGGTFWRKTMSDGSYSSIIVNATGSFVYCGGGGGVTQAGLIQVSNTGTLVSQKILGGYSSVGITTVSFDNSANTVLFGGNFPATLSNTNPILGYTNSSLALTQAARYGTNSINATVTGCAVGASSTKYFTGYYGTFNAHNALIIKTNATLNSITFQASIANTSIDSIASDSGGNIYIAGRSYVGGNSDRLYLAKLNSSNARVWEKEIRKINGTGGIGNVFTGGESIKVQGSHVYVSCFAGDSTGTIYNPGVLKFNTDGLTVGTFSGPAGDYVVANVTKTYTTLTNTLTLGGMTLSNTAYTFANSSVTWTPQGFTTLTTELL